ncbi:hypothetical protein F4782DRAFT_526224 [Xylaria castorea]|nr:hypothetical protein F4782DRAFT_526224 [Xylaria castorea]
MSQSQNTVQNENHSRSDSTAPPDYHQQEAHHVPSASTAQAEMAQAFRDLTRGEQQAAAIEANLASLESKLDALLASIEDADPAEVNGNTDENLHKDRASEEKQK